MATIHGKNYGKPTLDLNFAGNKSLVDSTTGTNYVTFSRAQSGNEATYVGSDGLIKYASADEPRFDHDPETGESLGLLLENAATNEITSSMPTSGGGGITNTSISGLPGVFETARKFTSSGGNDKRIILGSNISGVTFTYSFYAKLGTQGTSVFIRNGTGPYVTFDLSNQTISNNGWIANSEKMENVGNGWYRCSARAIGNGASGFLVGVATGNGLTSNAGDNMIVGGFQLERSSYPTSYIPTSGSTVTRAADEASITGTNFSSWYNQSEGTIYADFDKATTERQNPFALSDGTQTNRMSAYYINTTVVTYMSSPAGGFDQSVYTTSSPLFSKYVLGYSSGNTRLAINGNLGTIITEPNLPTNTTLFLGRTEKGDILYMLTGHISRLSYYPKRLPDIELQQLTK